MKQLLIFLFALTTITLPGQPFPPRPGPVVIAPTTTTSVGGSATNVSGGTFSDVTLTGSSTIPTATTVAHTTYTTNNPTRGLNDRAAMTPDLTINWWYVHGGVKTYFTNFTYYSSNLVRAFKTNGYYAAGWRWLGTDGGWAQTTRTAGGLLTWNTNYWENSTLPMTLPAWIDFMHENKWKVLLYTALTTNACDLPPSPINYIYQDIRTMMEWGADGVKIDNCGFGDENAEYYTAYYRTVNQAINDHYQAVEQTNGICRPFKIITTGSSGEGWPNQMTSDMLYGVNQSSFQPSIIHYDISSVAPWESEGITNGTSMIREVINFKPFFRPGHVVYTGIGVYGNNPGNWSNMLALAILGAQPIEAGLGAVEGHFNTGAPPSGDNWENFYVPTFGQYLTNLEVNSLITDPLVIPASITYSNTYVEVWNRPLVNGEIALGISNLGLTNRTETFNWYDLDVKPAQAYTVRDVWNRTNLFTFTNSFTHTQTPESVSLFRLIPKDTLLHVATVMTDNLNVSGPGIVNTRHEVKGVMFNGSPSGTVIHLNPLTGAASHADYRVVAAYTTRPTILSNLWATVTFAAAATNRYWRIYTNGTASDLAAVSVVTSTSVPVKFTGSNLTASVTIPAGVGVTLVCTNESGTAQTTYATWSYDERW